MQRPLARQPLAEASRAYTNAVVDSSMSPSEQLDFRSTMFCPSGFTDICRVIVDASRSAEARPGTMCATSRSSSRGVKGGDVVGGEGDAGGGNEGCVIGCSGVRVGVLHSPDCTISSKDTALEPPSARFPVFFPCTSCRSMWCSTSFASSADSPVFRMICSMHLRTTGLLSSPPLFSNAMPAWGVGGWRVTNGGPRIVGRQCLDDSLRPTWSLLRRLWHASLTTKIRSRFGNHVNLSLMSSNALAPGCTDKLVERHLYMHLAYLSCSIVFVVAYPTKRVSLQPVTADD